MRFNKLLQAALLSLTIVQSAALSIGAGQRLVVKPSKRQALQDIHSLFVRGERILFYSGKFHPFRLPVPSLWLDALQKPKALGYNGVSIYTDWALLEGKEGDFSAEGIFDLDPFFDAAKTAGIYILARPGPYINAEVSGGGFPGWLSRNTGRPRTRDEAYLNATTNYVNSISRIIAKAQITNGGPVILLQPENGYTVADMALDPEFPDPVYFQYVEDQYRNNGIVVPLISNDASPKGYFAPGPPRQEAAVDIYGHDGYPLGGSFDPWGGLGFAQCTELLGPEFERVFYKNDFSFGLTIFNIDMTYGGTNWGNLGHPGGYTSYDYGAVIAEDRTIAREKYSAAKLIANFLQASPAFLTAIYQNNTSANGSYVNTSAIAVTALFGATTKFLVRHAVYNSFDSTDYRITLPTSTGNVSIPQLGGSLSLHGRDSKFFVTDYDVGGVNLLYSTAEIFTSKRYTDKTVLVVYGGPDGTNELAIQTTHSAHVLSGPEPSLTSKDGYLVVDYNSTTGNTILKLETDCGCMLVYLLDRNTAYDYWSVGLPDDPVSGNYTNATSLRSSLIVKAGYLVRTADVVNGCIHLTGDLNATTTIEIIGGAPKPIAELVSNGECLKFSQDANGVVTATAHYRNISFSVPDLSNIGWKVLDSLPEIQASYDDSAWTTASLTYSNNTARNLTTPRSLYASDYGYNTGNLLYRGHFVATGNETSLYLSTQGGSAFGHSLWLNGTFLSSFNGGDKYSTWNQTYSLPKTAAGKAYVLTVLLDNMGLDENYDAGASGASNPRGILDYHLAGRSKSDITWKLIGNLHGEDYEDKTRGPLNEGGLYAERQGYHLPGAPTSSWKHSAKGPMTGLSTAGVAFYTVSFPLDLPKGYDIPLSFSFGNSSANVSSVPSYRCQIYVNGYQFGKYVHSIGPQDVFPVPEGSGTIAGRILSPSACGYWRRVVRRWRA